MASRPSARSSRGTVTLGTVLPEEDLPAREENAIRLRSRLHSLGTFGGKGTAIGTLIGAPRVELTSKAQ